MVSCITKVILSTIIITPFVALLGVFESLKGILHDGNVDVRVQYMIEVMFAVRKDGFKEHPAITDGLELVDEDDQITHLLSLEDKLEGEDALRKPSVSILHVST